MISVRQSECPLSDLAYIEMGQSPKKEFVNKTGTGLPLLNGPTEFGASHPTPVQWTTKPSRVAKTGDLLFCVRGSTTGRMNWADQDYAIGRGIAAIRAQSVAESHFVKAAITIALPGLLSAATGSTFPNVSGQQLRSLAVPAWHSGERARLGSIFLSFANLINSNRKVFQICSDLLDSYSQEWSDGLESVPLEKIATLSSKRSNPSTMTNELVDHYSIPAFDSGKLPERVPPETILSTKTLVTESSILVSRLNPRINRTWWVDPDTSYTAQ